MDSVTVTQYLATLDTGVKMYPFFPLCTVKKKKKIIMRLNALCVFLRFDKNGECISFIKKHLLYWILKRCIVYVCLLACSLLHGLCWHIALAPHISATNWQSLEEPTTGGRTVYCAAHMHDCAWYKWNCVWLADIQQKSTAPRMR